MKKDKETDPEAVARLQSEQDEIVSARSGFGRQEMTMTKAEYDARSVSVEELNEIAVSNKENQGGF